jgi:hypothetical protein
VNKDRNNHKDTEARRLQRIKVKVKGEIFLNLSLNLLVLSVSMPPW